MSIRTIYKDSEFGRKLIDMDRRVQRDLDDLEGLRGGATSFEDAD